MPAPATSSRCWSEADDHRRHPVRPAEADRPRVDDLPRPGHRGRHRAQDQERPGKARHRDPEARRGGPDLPGPERRGDRSDDHQGDGRAPPRDPRRSHAAASSRSRPTSASPRSPTARRSRGSSSARTSSTRSRPAVRASTPRCRSSSNRSSALPTARLRVRQRGHRRPHPQGVHPVHRPGQRRRPCVRHPGGLPARRREDDVARRRIPRGRLVGDGLQDPRFDGVQGGCAGRPARRCSNR